MRIAMGGLLFAALLLPLGCRSATGLQPAADAYALARVDDAPLPARVGDETWLADTIRLGDGDCSRVEVVRLHSEGAPPDPVRRESDGFTTRIGDRIVLDFDCDDVILRSCAAPDTVRVAGAELVRVPNRYGQPAGVGAAVFRYLPTPP